MKTNRTKARFIKTLYFITLFAIALSCSEEDTSINKPAKGGEESVDEALLYDDPLYGKGSTLESGREQADDNTVRVKEVSVYMARKQDASSGKVVFRLFAKGNKKIGSTFYYDVKNLPVTSSVSDVQYKIINVGFNKDLVIDDEYWIEVTCDDCADVQNSSSSKAVLWWGASSDVYEDGCRIKNSSWECDGADFAFKTKNKSSDTYYDQKQYEKTSYKEINGNVKWGQQFKPDVKNICSDYRELSVENFSQIRVNNNTQVRVEFDLENTSSYPLKMQGMQYIFTFWRDSPPQTSMPSHGTYNPGVNYLNPGDSYHVNRTYTVQSGYDLRSIAIHNDHVVDDEDCYELNYRIVGNNVFPNQ